VGVREILGVGHVCEGVEGDKLVRGGRSTLVLVLRARGGRGAIAEIWRAPAHPTGGQTQASYTRGACKHA
jgi:hypothetical protein